MNSVQSQIPALKEKMVEDEFKTNRTKVALCNVHHHEQFNGAELPAWHNTVSCSASR